MSDKRGISGVVTAVLLILLVIAAIAILWIVIQGFVERNSESIAGSADCLETSLEITEIVTGSSDGTVKIKRTRGSAAIAEVRVIIDGSSEAAAGFMAGKEIGESEVLSGQTIASGDLIEVAAVVGETLCTIADSENAP